MFTLELFILLIKRIVYGASTIKFNSFFGTTKLVIMITVVLSWLDLLIY